MVTKAVLVLVVGGLSLTPFTERTFEISASPLAKQNESDVSALPGIETKARCQTVAFNKDDDCVGEKYSFALKACVCTPSGTCPNSF
jgi:hypothetical protein